MVDSVLTSEGIDKCMSKKEYRASLRINSGKYDVDKNFKKPPFFYAQVSMKYGK